MAAIVFLMLGLLFSISVSGAEAIGVCYGKLGDNLPADSEVISLFKSNGIGKMRIYWPDSKALEALRGSGIELIVDVPRESLEPIATNPDAASGWLRDNLLPFKSDVSLRYIAVGNEIQSDEDNARHVLPAMRNLHAAVAAAGMSGVKVSTAVDMGIVTDSYPPSKGAFKVVDYAGPIAKFLAETNSPLLVNAYPYKAYAGGVSGINLGYALGASREMMPDGTPYGSMMEAQVDAVYAALEKAGAAGVTVVVSETGWPSQGAGGASLENAATYYQNVVERVNTGAGTPMKPDKGPIEAYLFAMFDENKKDGDEEKHFGLFSPDRQPKYKLSFA